MGDVEFKFEGSLGFDGKKGNHKDGSNRIWSFAFGHKIKGGWDSANIEHINDVYPMLRAASEYSTGLLVAIPRNGGGELPIVEFNLDLFKTKGSLHPTTFSIHVYKTEGGQFPAHRELAFFNVSRVSVKSTIFQPYWVNGNPVGFGADDPSYDVHHFTYGSYEISS